MFDHTRSLSVSNQQFLETIAGPLWREVLVTSFNRDPADPTAPREDWNGWLAGDVLTNPHFDEGNTYFCPSLLIPGTRDRRLENFRSLHVIVIDDVGTKIQLSEVCRLLGQPTYMIETSPGNHQAGWVIEPESDLAWVKGMLVQLDQALGHQADNLTNPIAWRRLPVGFNTKAAVVTACGPKGWQVKLSPNWPGPTIRGLDWPCEIEPRIGEIARLTTTDRGLGDGARPDESVLRQDPVYCALETAGYILGEKLTSDKFWAVTVKCPWVAGHGPTRPLTGAEYVPAGPGTRGWFHCFHCERRSQAEFREQLDQVLRDDGCKIVAAFDFDPIDPSTISVDPRTGSLKLAGYEGTEDGLALAFADQHATKLRFDHTRGRWFRWTGDFWREDSVEYAFRWARELLRVYRAKLQDATAGQVRMFGKVAMAAAIERAARADPQLAVDGLSWDQDPYLVGAPGCEIDLSTGVISTPDQAHGITKQLLVAPRSMPTPLWDQFLWDSTGGDPEAITFLQAWTGYCLTGDTSEEKFVFVYGPGGNGKSTFLATVAAIQGSYAVNADADVFMIRKHDAHPEEIARLAGARSVTIDEIKSGRTFDAGRIKNLTGKSGKVSARFMRQNSFEFTPQFKLTIVGNHQPRLPDVDAAIRRRMVLVPFTQTPIAIDTTLKDQLVGEYPGILHWMIEGELIRRTVGGLSHLVPTAAVQATEEYLAEQDTLKTWAEERCAFGPNMQVSVTKALEDYRVWCHTRGEQIDASTQEFSRKFVDRFPNCWKKHTRTGWALIGASLSPQAVDV